MVYTPPYPPWEAYSPPPTHPRRLFCVYMPPYLPCTSGCILPTYRVPQGGVCTAVYPRVVHVPLYTSGWWVYPGLYLRMVGIPWFIPQGGVCTRDTSQGGVCIRDTSQGGGYTRVIPQGGGYTRFIPQGVHRLRRVLLFLRVYTVCAECSPLLLRPVHKGTGTRYREDLCTRTHLSRFTVGQHFSAHHPFHCWATLSGPWALAPVCLSF